MKKHERRQLRARIGMHLTGPMPTIREMMAKFRLRASAAASWHAKLARARREFA